MEPPSEGSPKRKRTRTNVKQSKFGCFTCKKRKVKCDETKPSCRRCVVHKIPCSGFPRGAPPGPQLRPSASAVNRIKPSLSEPPSRYWNRHTQLACTVLARGPRLAKSTPEMVFWTRLVPQMVHALPFVQSAASAFGAIFEEHMLRPSPIHSSSQSLQLYSQALRHVQAQALDSRLGVLPRVVACLFLAFSEVMQQRGDIAYLHLQGAFNIMTSSAKGKPIRHVEDEGVSTLFEKLNIHAATYVSGRGIEPPSLYPTPRESALSSPDRALYRVLQAAYSFKARAWRHKYASFSLIPPDFFIEQDHHLQNLQQWLLCNRMEHSRSISGQDDEQLAVLRAQCLAGLISTANSLDATEMAHDGYHSEFQEIIEMAENILRLRKRAAGPSTMSGGMPSFCPEMGIIQPLFITALKYRNAFWRRKALTLLLKSGREGPWCGPVEARVVKAVIEAEEGAARDSRLDDEVDIRQRGIHEAWRIPESQRIHQCRVIDYVHKRSNWNTDSGLDGGLETKYAVVWLQKCCDIEAMQKLEESAENQGGFALEEKHWFSWTVEVPMP